MSVSEQDAYEAMIFLFYGKIFGLVPKSIINDTEKIFNEMNQDFDTSCAEDEGWNNKEQVYEFVGMIKSMTKSERIKFMKGCPSKLLKKFIKKELK